MFQIKCNEINVITENKCDCDSKDEDDKYIRNNPPTTGGQLMLVDYAPIRNNGTYCDTGKIIYVK